MLGFLEELFSVDRPPNNFTEFMGMLVRQAREEAGLSQAELAEKMYTRQATISDIENGKKWARAVDLIYFSSILRKPILFFIPDKYRRRVEADFSDQYLAELMLVARELEDEDLRRLTIQARALVEAQGRSFRDKSSS